VREKEEMGRHHFPDGGREKSLVLVITMGRSYLQLNGFVI
jgi:hypothetical protein